MPLVFIELKASHRQFDPADQDNLRDYKETIPISFWYNALIILFNDLKKALTIYGSALGGGVKECELPVKAKQKRVEELRTAIEDTKNILHGVGSDHGKMLKQKMNLHLSA